MKQYTKRGLKLQYKNRTLKNGGSFFGNFFGNGKKPEEQPKPTDAVEVKTPLDNKPVSEQSTPEDINTYIHMSEKVSMQSISIDYKQVGIFHITESTAVNAIKGIGTGIVNLAGYSGFTNTVYDKLRNDVLKKVDGILKDGQKVFNIKMDFETSPEGTIYLHLYGDLCESIGQEIQKPVETHVSTAPVSSTSQIESLNEVKP